MKQSEIVGGAPINCGRGCTIVQTADTLRVSRTHGPGSDRGARAGAPAPDSEKEGAKPREDVVYLDNRTTPGNTTVARLDGSRLVLVRSFASINVTQTLSLEKERLVVEVTVAGARTGPYRLT